MTKLEERQKKMKARLSGRGKTVATKKVRANGSYPAGWIYIVRIMPHGPTKIGLSWDGLENRLKHIDYEIPYPTKCLGVKWVGHAEESESQLHFLLEPLRIKGEWFNLSDVQLQVLIKQHEFKTREQAWLDRQTAELTKAGLL